MKNGCLLLCLEVRKSNVFEAVKQSVIEMSEMIATANAKSIEDIIAIFNNTAERFSF